MKTTVWLSIAALIGSLVLAGCEPAANDGGGPAAGAAKEYPIKGKVVSVAEDKSAVTLDHEDIPDLMPGMEMQFTIDDPQVLEGIEAGTDVEGRLKVEDGTYTITRLEKRSP